MKGSLVFLLLLLPLVLKAQQSSKILLLNRDTLFKEYEISIHDNWLFHPGDDSKWAAKNFNDSSWEKGVHTYINVGNKEDDKIKFEGLGWFRYHFRTDTSLNETPIALRMSQSGASAIYMDGKKIVSYGAFTKDKSHEYTDPKNEPLVILIPDSGAHVLAVKYENLNAKKRFQEREEDMAGFMLEFATTKSSISSYDNESGQMALFLPFSFIFLTLFIVHLILYLFYRADVSNLYFSLFNLGIALLGFVSYLGISTNSIEFSDFLMPLFCPTLALACFSISAFLNKLFGKSKIRFRIIMLLCIIGAIMPYIKFEYANSALAILTIICSLEALILLLVAMYKKTPGAKIIGVGIVFTIVFFAVIIVIASINDGVQIGEEHPFLALFVLLLGALAIFSIPFSLSAYLAWSFAKTNKDLNKQLKQVEQLSQEALRHEQEKQQLLENRSEELEKEVTLRTTEVIHQKEQIEQQHEALKSEKKKSDELLLNILPAEVAEELKEKGKSKAQLFDDVSVLFTDFVNFTQISERLGAEELVAELHECFQAFDEIMERNGMEKIKTIGDAYLAVSGMPVHNDFHAHNAIKAGMEIVAFMKARNVHSKTFEIRIGIHSGPLVAGIVGVKKFAYDIWGDTVNTAARMESTSEAGKINISEATHKLVENDFTFTYRGKIDAKHKGEIDMYFVESSNPI